MTPFAETMAARAHALDLDIAQALDDVARRVRRDLLASADPEDLPTAAEIESSVDAVLSLQRDGARAWRSQELMRYAREIDPPAVREDSRCRS